MDDSCLCAAQASRLAKQFWTSWMHPRSSCSTLTPQHQWFYGHAQTLLQDLSLKIFVCASTAILLGTLNSDLLENSMTDAGDIIQTALAEMNPDGLALGIITCTIPVMIPPSKRFLKKAFWILLLWQQRRSAREGPRCCWPPVHYGAASIRWRPSHFGRRGPHHQRVPCMPPAAVRRGWPLNLLQTDEFGWISAAQVHLSIIEFPPPNATALFLTFRTNCPDGSHFV